MEVWGTGNCTKIDSSSYCQITICVGVRKVVIRLKKSIEEHKSKIGVEIRHIVVDSLENGEVELFLRPNASLACRASPTASKRSLYVHLQPNSGFRILRDQVDDSLM